MKRKRYATARPIRTKRQAAQDQADRDEANRIHELEGRCKLLESALAARLEPTPAPSHLDDLQALLDDLRAHAHEVKPAGCSQRAMNAVMNLVPWGRPPQQQLPPRMKLPSCGCRNGCKAWDCDK